MLRKHADIIIKKSIESVLPNEAVIKALKYKDLENITLIAIGKAAYQMAKTASELLKDKIKKGIIITKYNHSEGYLHNIDIYEASHPIPDQNTIIATEKVIEIAKNLTKEDQVLFLLSGGGSSLFEKPLEGITLLDIQNITKQLLGCGADIMEINTIRKHLSSVKGGRFAEICMPAKIFSIVLSDVIDNKLDFIASGPCQVDSSTSEEAINIVEKYNLNISPIILDKLKIETPKNLNNIETIVTGSVKELCFNASSIAKNLGYNTILLTTSLDCEAKEAGKMLASIAKSIVNKETEIQLPCAIILGGETIVHLKGNGKGGRNQELAFSASFGIKDLENVLIFSVGSDGTDGPTDAAGGIVDGQSINILKQKNLDPAKMLDNNDAYNALSECDGLVITNPTGTNVNDLTVLLCSLK